MSHVVLVSEAPEIGVPPLLHSGEGEKNQPSYFLCVCFRVEHEATVPEGLLLHFFEADLLIDLEPL